MQFKVALVSLFAALAIASPLEKRCTANGGSCTQLSQCCSGNCEYGNCEYSIGDSNAYCRATSKKREAEPVPEPEPALEKRCSANGVTCNFNNAECCSGNCLYSLGDSNAYCAATSKKREAEPAAEPELEKRCTANGGSCTQLSQCCSGNCEYDSSIGLVCKA
ncbi:hypothetical protein HDK90DRAFT_483552 [Phyllosticta capitalensis]|uniref:Uncharacterized protein n=1 Tax=Phyllosticta capitalensis TaxID=121624 RepID=A0ABR1YVH9_9PEZI